jgi:ribosomal protein S27E
MEPHRALPVWGEGIPELDSAARTYTLLRVPGRQAPTPGGALPEWSDWVVRRGIPAEAVSIPADQVADWVRHATSRMAEVLDGRVVGWRLAVSGEESAVMAARSAALRAHLLSAEITCHVDSREWVQVFCASCGARTLGASAARVVVCSGCGRALVAHAHSSISAGLYLADSGPDSRADPVEPTG